ncbi:hypothetical protein G6F65_019804 [Rhizopus arrhizus]|nr:hypothetical protein G6F65_019804 [Rhizopus arrhizus]
MSATLGTSVPASHRCSVKRLSMRQRTRSVRACMPGMSRSASFTPRWCAASALLTTCPGVHGADAGQRRQPFGGVVVRQVQQDGVAVPDVGAAIGQRGDLLEGADALEFRRLVLAGQHVDKRAV